MLKDVIVDQRISHVEVSLILSLLIHRGCEPYGMKRMLDNIATQYRMERALEIQRHKLPLQKSNNTQ